MVRLLSIMLAVLAALSPAGATPLPAPVVLAAASLQEALSAAADDWARRSHPRPVLSFAASSSLARQLLAGAPGDLFIAADEEWMDALAARRLLAPGTRADLAGNRLVVVEVAGRPNPPLRAAGLIARMRRAGPLAMADPDAVPAGRYGRAALTKLGAWNALEPKVVRTENVRAALALVERGAAPFGIVYLTDARASAKVRVAGVFPAWTHPPIRYPIARLARSRSAEAEQFRRFLLSREGRAIFARFGFPPP